MDRRKAEARRQLNKLSEECQVTCSILHNLLSNITTILNGLEQTPNEEIAKQPQRFLDIAKLQSESHQKILEVNFYLENFYLKHHHLLNNTLSKPAIELHKMNESKLSPELPDSLITFGDSDLPTRAINSGDNHVDPLSENVDVFYLNMMKEYVENLKTAQSCRYSSSESWYSCDLPDHDEIFSPGDTSLDESTPALKDKSAPAMTNGSAAALKEESAPALKNKVNCATNGENSLPNDPSIVTERKEKINLNHLIQGFVREKENLRKYPDLSFQPTGIFQSAMSQKKNPCEEIPSTNPIEEVEECNDVRLCAPELKNVITEFQDIIPPLNAPFHISYAVSPSEFYIQPLTEANSFLEVLTDQLQEVYAYSSCHYSTKEETRENLGRCCTAFVKEFQLWFRVEVLDWYIDNPNEHRVFVQLIDYGDSCDVHYQHLRAVSKEICCLPKIAQCCHLAHLYPPNSTNAVKLEYWNDDSNETFFNYIGEYNEKIFILQFIEQTKDSLAIDFRHQNQDNDDTVGGFLIDSGFAVEIFERNPNQDNFVLQQLAKARKIEHLKPNMDTGEFPAQILENNDDKNEPVMGYDARDEQKTCRFLRPDGTCFKGPRRNLDHTPLSRDGFTTDAGESFRMNAASILIPHGANIDICVTSVLSVRSFYGQILGPPSMSQYDELLELVKFMNCPEIVKTCARLRLQPSPGQLVIVKHWHGSWYRGQINDTFDENGLLFEVFVVDYGDTVIVSIDKLRHIKQEFLNIPFQAMRCNLSNVKCNPEVDPSEAIQYVESRFLSQTLKATVLSASGCLEVLLLDADGKDVGVRLIEAGFGLLNDKCFFPASNEEHMLIE